MSLDKNILEVYQQNGKNTFTVNTAKTKALQGTVKTKAFIIYPDFLHT